MVGLLDPDHPHRRMVEAVITDNVPMSIASNRSVLIVHFAGVARHAG